MAEIEAKINFENGLPTALPGIGLEPLLHETVILRGSNAEYGYRIPGTGEKGEVFMYTTRQSPHTSLEVYPLDGTDEPVIIEVACFDFAEESVVGAINSAYQLRSAR